jgi:hypothetical protein
MVFTIMNSDGITCMQKFEILYKWHLEWIWLYKRDLNLKYFIKQTFFIVELFPHRWHDAAHELNQHS